MKSFIIPALLLLSGIIFSCCDKSQFPYTVAIDPNRKDTTPYPFPADSIHYRTVLLEEFTAHTCHNCPTAAIEVYNLENQLGDSLVVITVHYGLQADPLPGFPENLHTPLGDALGDAFYVPAIPTGIIDRRRNSFDTLFAVDPYTNWASVISSELAGVPLIDMQMINEFDIDSPYTVKIHVQTEYLVNVNNPLKLAVYVTEDDIIGNQSNSNDAIGPDTLIGYHFMNVLRGEVNSIWGDDLNTTPVAAGKLKYYNYCLTIKNNWNHDNCYIVAFVSDAITKKVLAAIKKKVEP